MTTTFDDVPDFDLLTRQQRDLGQFKSFSIEQQQAAIKRFAEQHSISLSDAAKYKVLSVRSDELRFKAHSSLVDLFGATDDDRSDQMSALIDAIVGCVKAEVILDQIITPS